MGKKFLTVYDPQDPEEDIMSKTFVFYSYPSKPFSPVNISNR